MADYGQSCCGLMGGHKESCRLHHNYENWKARSDDIKTLRAKGFVVIDENHGLYGCRRGCGTVVWNPEIHMKNVCTTFTPVVGSE